jgi:beta-glucosidase
MHRSDTMNHIEEVEGGAADESVRPHVDPNLPIEARVDDLVGRMTLKEKVSQMVHDAPAIERLGVPKYNWWNECLHGVGRAGLATTFPQAIGLAASWNTGLMHDIATVISDEARAKHHEFARRDIRGIYSGLTYWSPNINIFRDPRWGRGQETYGEDPYLTARMGVTFVKGLQGDDPRYLKLVATPKHFAVHSGREADRHRFDVSVNERDLRTTYLPAFEACVREADAASVMGAYNRVDGEPACAHSVLLGEILRQEWEFKGYVVSDCWAIRDFYESHKVVDTPAEAAALAVNKGCDLNCGDAYMALLDAVEAGLISEETIDLSVKRLFTARFRLGMFDPPQQVPYAQIPYEVTDCEAHRALALRAARESIVLLKNSGSLLPLSKDLRSIAVIGPNADDPQVLLGNYNGTPSSLITPLEGIRAKVSRATTVYHAQGCEIAPGVPPLAPIPSEYLRPDGAGLDERGLAGAYYDNTDLTGNPSITRVDPTVDFDWKGLSGVSGGLGEHFSARWTGSLTVPSSGTYRLGVRGFSGYRLALDGDQLVEHENIHHPITTTVDVAMEANRAYRVQLEYVSRGLDPQVQLLWSGVARDYGAEAVEAAQKADVIVMVMGISASLEGEEMPVEVEGFDRGDRTDIRLPRPQELLLERIHAMGKPVVLVLLNGSALAVNWADDHVPAIVEAWYPGQAGGAAIADVLFGDYNPAGRLPVTFYRSVDDLPPFEDYRMEGHTYRYFRGTALYRFGHGLSYSRFAYSNLKLSAECIPAGDSVSVSIDVANMGERAGDEVVQLYLSDVAASVPVAKRQLAGFRRVHLEPGAKRNVTFCLSPRQFSLIDDAGHRVIEPGAFQITVGGRQPSAEDIVATTDDLLIATLGVVGQVMEIRV